MQLNLVTVMGILVIVIGIVYLVMRRRKKRS
jgi:LPXTG-motif cell wall-anchored protein